MNKKGSVSTSYVLVTLSVCLAVGLAFNGVSKVIDSSAIKGVNTVQSEESCMLSRGEWNSESRECNAPSNEIIGNVKQENTLRQEETKQEESKTNGPIEATNGGNNQETPKEEIKQEETVKTDNETSSDIVIESCTDISASELIEDGMFFD